MLDCLLVAQHHSLSYLLSRNCEGWKPAWGLEYPSIPLPGFCVTIGDTCTRFGMWETGGHHCLAPQRSGADVWLWQMEAVQRSARSPVNHQPWAQPAWAGLFSLAAVTSCSETWK